MDRRNPDTPVDRTPGVPCQQNRGQREEFVFIGGVMATVAHAPLARILLSIAAHDQRKLGSRT
jgi:hypothetical protein